MQLTNGPSIMREVEAAHAANIVQHSKLGSSESPGPKKWSQLKRASAPNASASRAAVRKAGQSAPYCAIWSPIRIGLGLRGMKILAEGSLGVLRDGRLGTPVPEGPVGYSFTEESHARSHPCLARGPWGRGVRARYRRRSRRRLRGGPAHPGHREPGRHMP